MTQGKPPLLSLSGVTAYYGAVQALKGVDLEVHEGEIVTLIGANGAGKSTLMMTICGNPQARDGSIVTAAEADAMAEAEHPNGTLSFAPHFEGMD